ncbi:hypothetical protein ACQP2X_46935 [Actinoplanes sp. CA-131856]
MVISVGVGTGGSVRGGSGGSDVVVVVGAGVVVAGAVVAGALGVAVAEVAGADGVAVVVAGTARFGRGE